jgi:uncharacterized membrane protein YfcA
VQGTRARLTVTAGVGLAAGFLSGVFGVGGGILIVPGLVLVLRMEQRLAHGTSLAAILPIASAGMIGFAVDHAVDWSAGALIIAGAVVGALVGARLLGRLPERTLRYGFAVLLLATATRLLISTPPGTGRGALEIWLAIGLVALGLAAGAIAGLLGVGGGIIIIPALVVLFAVPDEVAKGTSLFVIIPTAISGTFVNLRAENVDVRVGAIVGLTGAAAAYGGSKIATAINEHLSAVLFAGLLIAVSVQLVLARPKTVKVT